MEMKEIRITDIGGIRVGHATRKDKGSGVTAVIAEQGLLTSCEVRGGSPATRDTDPLRPEMANQTIFGVVLTGGSAYGLNSLTGVMNWLTEKGIGKMVRSWRIPVVTGASIFDFPLSNGEYTPDTALGYEAAANAKGGPVEEGCVGGGTGASVSKYRGPEHAFKSGIGTYGLQLGGLKVAAIVNVNAFGDIYDAETGEQLTGPRADDDSRIFSTEELMFRDCAAETGAGAGRAGDTASVDAAGAGRAAGNTATADGAGAEADDDIGANTTVGLIVTNARLTKGQLHKVCGLTHNGYARAIRPVHTTRDGDTVFAMTTGEVDAPADTVGMLAAKVMAKAIARAVRAAEPMKGYPTVTEFRNRLNH